MKNYEVFCVSEDETVREVMETFENNNERVAIVRGSTGKVIGVVSQGDIIRALTAGMDINCRVQQIIRSSFLYARERNFEKIYKIFKTKKITLLPIVDSDFQLTGVVTLDDIFQYLEEKGKTEA